MPIKVQFFLVLFWVETNELIDFLGIQVGITLLNCIIKCIESCDAFRDSVGAIVYELALSLGSIYNTCACCWEYHKACDTPFSWLLDKINCFVALVWDYGS